MKIHSSCETEYFVETHQAVCGTPITSFIVSYNNTLYPGYLAAAVILVYRENNSTIRCIRTLELYGTNITNALLSPFFFIF